MKNAAKRGFLREHAGGLALAVLLHAAILGFLFVGYLKFRSQPKPVQPQMLAIEAVVVDEKLIAAESRRLDEEARRKEHKQREETERVEQVKREREAEEERLSELKQQRDAQEEERRQAAELEVKRKATEESKAALERKRKVEEEAKAGAERQRKQEEQKKKAAAEAKQRAAELKRQMDDEERMTALRSSDAMQSWLAQITARIQRAWLRPPSATAGIDCMVYVTQVVGGQVVSVRVGECNGDAAVRQSIEAAVLRASPLPPPPDPALFDRNLEIRFKPTE